MKFASLLSSGVLARVSLLGFCVFSTSSLASAQVNESLKLTASDGAAGDGFGFSVAVCGTTAVVGAHGDDDNGGDSGSAYLFDVATGQQLAKLLPDDGDAGDRFGTSVAISGTTALVGARGDDDKGPNSGSVYVFDVTTGQQLMKLLPGDGDDGDAFGYAVAVSGATAVVGAPLHDFGAGSAYLFDVALGLQVAKLIPGDGASGDLFGSAVAVSGTTAAIGAWLDDDNGTESGSAYLFDAITGQQLAKLLPGDGEEYDVFGYAVAVSGAIALVGAYCDDDNGPDSGAAYFFDVATGLQLAKLLPDDGGELHAFGNAVAVSETTAVVGAAGVPARSAYVFNAATGQQLAKLQSSDDASAFGAAVGLSGSIAIVGAPGDEAAYVFDLPMDCNENGVPDSEDIANGTSQDCDRDGQPDECQLKDPANDWNGDGILDACVSANFCVAESNSTGIPAVIGAAGTPVALENDFTLEAWDLPLNEFAYFLASESTAFIPGFGGSSGNLCLGPPQYRFNVPAGGGKILNSGSTGTVSFTLDLNLLPQNITFDPGETWYFQLWYRDFIASGPTSNTTDGIEVMFR